MHRIRSPKLLATASLACLFSGLALSALTATPASAYLGEPKSQTFTEVGKTLHFTVPEDASLIHIRSIGGSGADGRFTCNQVGFCRKGGTGGHGGSVEMDLSVIAGQDLQIVLGSAATSSKPGSGGAGGGFAGRDSEWSVLPEGTGDGGGATYIYRSDASVIAVAAGGGGGGGASDSGEDPNGIGGDGGDGVDGRGYAGHDGTTAGAGGSGSSGKQSGANGQSASIDINAGGGGGGGGGYQPNGTGGGAGGRAGKELLFGGAGGGGAGGHSFSIASNAVIAPAAGYGDGQVVITWTSNRATFPTTFTLRSSANPSWLGEPITFTVDLQVKDSVGYGGGTGYGTVIIGTVDPATGMEIPQAYWDLDTYFASYGRPDGIFWKTVLPAGFTQVWASYSGDKSNGPWKSSYLTQLVGPVRPRAVLVLPSSSVDFGAQSVGTVTTKTVTIENNSATPWKVASTALSSPQFRWTGGTCGPTSLALNAKCTVDVSFRPTGVSAVSGTLTLTDEVGNPTVITITGSGIAVTPGGPPPAPTTTTTPRPTTTVPRPTTTTPTPATTTKPTTTTPTPTTNTPRPTTTVQAVAAAPTITRISPASGPRKGGTAVTITGTNLVNVTAIRFGSNPAMGVTCSSATTCTAIRPQGSDRVNVRVTTPAGMSALSQAARFRYTD